MQEATITAITPVAGGAADQVDLDKDRAATIREWQIIEKL